MVSERGGLLENINGYKRKSFHRICIILLTAMFVSLIVVMLLQDFAYGSLRDDHGNGHHTGSGLQLRAL